MRKKIFTFLLALAASVGMSWATENSIVINGTPQVGDNSISLTYYFDPANVPGICCYAPTLKVKCVTDNNWDEKWLDLGDISSGTETITLNTLGSFQAGKEYAICYAYYNGSWVDDVFQSVSFPAAPAPVVLADCGLGWLNVPEGGVVGTIGHEDEIVLPQVNASLDFILAFQAHTATLRLGSTDESVLAVYGFNNFAVNGVGECDVYVVHDEDAVFAYDSAAFHVTVNPEPAPQPAEDVNITPNVDPENPTVYYSTFYDSANKYALPAGVEAYVADLSGANLLLTKIAEAGEVIPANVAVILKSTVTPFTLTVSDADAVTFTATNDLQGSDTQIATPANCYVLAGTDGVVGFYHYTASQLNAHKAYVVYSGSNQAPRRMPFVFDQATGVENIQGDNVQSTKMMENGVLYIIKNGVKYNAQGQIVK